MEALKTSQAVPIGPVLARARAGEDVAWTRVIAHCAPTDPAPADGVRYGMREGEIVWRATSVCALADASWLRIIVDRGFVEASQGRMEPPALGLPPVRSVTGVLLPVSILSKQTGFETATAARPPADAAPLILMAEQEAPAPRGVTPSVAPPDIPNRHLEYALTWFGLAGALVAVYAALVRRTMKAA
jgi:surfeit locus 1 family protein